VTNMEGVDRLRGARHKAAQRASEASAPTCRMPLRCRRLDRGLAPAAFFVLGHRRAARTAGPAVQRPERHGLVALQPDDHWLVGGAVNRRAATSRHIGGQMRAQRR